MNAESEMAAADGLGGEPAPSRLDRLREKQGTIYAVVVVVEADTAEQAWGRVATEVGPEPANAHFVGGPVEIERDDEYDNRSVARQIVAAPTTSDGLGA